MINWNDAAANAKLNFMQLCNIYIWIFNSESSQHTISAFYVSNIQVAQAKRSNAAADAVIFSLQLRQQLLQHRLHLTIMRVESVCLSALSSAFPVERSRTPTAAFESLGLGYVSLTFPPTCHYGQLEGRGLSCRVFFPRWFCKVR